MSSLKEEIQCRTCLKDTLDVQSLFIDNIYKILMQCANIKIERDDGLPSVICTSCLHRLLEAQEFKTLAEVSDAKLRSNNEHKSLPKIVNVFGHFEQNESYKLENMENLIVPRVKEFDDDELSCTFSLLSSDTDEENLNKMEAFEQDEENIDKTLIAEKIANESDKLGIENAVSLPKLQNFENKSETPQESSIIKNHSKETIEDIPIESDESSNAEENLLVNVSIVECAKCKKGFSEIDLFNVHWQQHEIENTMIHPGFKLLSCSKCTESFNDPIEFEEHWLTHKIVNETSANNNLGGDNMCLVEVSKIIKFEKIKSKPELKQQLSEDIKDPNDNPNIENDTQVTNKIESTTLDKDKGRINLYENNLNNLVQEKDVSDKMHLRLRNKLKVSNIGYFDNESHHQYRKLRYMCQICGKMFLNIDAIISHRRKDHMSSKQCPVCAKELTHRKLYNHINYHRDVCEDENKKVYRCYLCIKSFKTCLKYTLHLRLHFDISGYKCLSCIKFFPTLLELIEHNKKHKGRCTCGSRAASGTACSKCNCIFHDRCLKRSKFSSIKDGCVICPSCNTDGKPVLKVAKNTTKCCYCNRLFIHKSNLKLHYSICQERSAKRMMKKPKPKLTLDPTMGYTCTQCDQSFNSWLEFKVHIKSHGMLPYNNVKPKNDLKKKYKCGCPVCFKYLPNLPQYRLHLKQHTPKEFKECSICKEELKDIHKKVQHEYLEHGIKNPIKKNYCYKCGSGFTSWKMLKEHFNKQHIKRKKTA